jgi:hypothetical protein
MTEEGIGVQSNVPLYDEAPLQTFLESKFHGLKKSNEIIYELIIQQKALTKDLNYLSVLRTRLQNTIGVLEIIAVDGCSLNTRHHHEQTREVLQERITFFEHVVLQRENSILFGKGALEKALGRGEKEE